MMDQMILSLAVRGARNSAAVWLSNNPDNQSAAAHELKTVYRNPPEGVLTERSVTRYATNIERLKQEAMK